MERRWSREEEAELLAKLDRCPQEGDPFRQAEGRRDLERAIAELDPKDAEIIRMKYYGGMIVWEIAERLHSPYETVKKRHQRSLSKLKALPGLILLLALDILSCQPVEAAPDWACFDNGWVPYEEGWIITLGWEPPEGGTLWTLDLPASVPLHQRSDEPPVGPCI